MAWKEWELRLQRRALRTGRWRARRPETGEVVGWVAARQAAVSAGPLRFRVGADDEGRPAYEIGARTYRGRQGDRIVAHRGDAVIVRRDYGDASGDGLWRNAVVYDLRPEVGRPGTGWRRYDLAWQVQRQVWRRCAALHAMRRWAPELLEWAEGEVRMWPQTLSERITEAERVVGGMTQGGELSAALVRSAALERPLGGIRQKKRGDTYGEE